MPETCMFHIRVKSSHVAYQVIVLPCTEHITRARDLHLRFFETRLRIQAPRLCVLSACRVSVLSTYRGHRYTVCERYLQTGINQAVPMYPVRAETARMAWLTPPLMVILSTGRPSHTAVPQSLG